MKTIVRAKFTGSKNPHKSLGFIHGKEYNFSMILFTQLKPRVLSRIHITYNDPITKEEVECAYDMEGFVNNWTNIRKIENPETVYHWGSIMPIGKYAGHELARVPREYLIFLFENEIPMPEGLWIFLASIYGDLKQNS
jgi:uncharacterized protein (DUF3820 family)